MSNFVQYYEVAGFSFSIKTIRPTVRVRSFIPFETEERGNIDFSIEQVMELFPFVEGDLLGTYDWFESVCSFYRVGDRFIWNRVDSLSGVVEQIVWEGEAPTRFQMCGGVPNGMYGGINGGICEGSGEMYRGVHDGMQGEIPNGISGGIREHVLEHLVLLAFNFATLSLGALVVHSSVIEYEGKGYVFLGESGTGKSTHTRLWLQHIPQSKLLNDDAPIIRIVNGEVMVFGSPWSGKGRVFENRGVPVCRICRLSQAPFNRLTPLSTHQAFAAMIHSCLPPLLAVAEYTDVTFDLLSEILKRTPLFHLACLPDAEAAKISSGNF